MTKVLSQVLPWALPSAISLTIVLFNMAKTGEDKWGMAMLGIAILMPVGGFLSVVHNLRVKPILKMSLLVTIIVSVLLIVILSLIIIANGATLGMAGIILSWVVLWLCLTWRLCSARPNLVPMSLDVGHR